MEGFKLIKTTFENNKEIIGVHFNGDQSYYSYVEEVRNTFNIPPTSEVQVYSKDFIIKPHIFTHFVAQYIANLDFVLDIKVPAPKRCSTVSITNVALPIASTMIADPMASTMAGSPKAHTMINSPIVTDVTHLNHLTRVTSPIDSNMLRSPVAFTSDITHSIPSSLVRCHIGIPFDANPEIAKSVTKGPIAAASGIPTTMEIRQMPEMGEFLSLKVLENKHRTRLAKAIVSLILTNNPEKRLLREDLLQLSQSIVELFPLEVEETYYVPFNKGHLAKGKLYDAYNNLKARLCASGVIRRRTKTKTQPIVASDDSNHYTGSDVDENELEIVKSGWADWDLVLQTWKKTHYFRRQEFINDNLDGIDYSEIYKVLQHERNYELIEIDFKMLYPASKSIYELKLYFQIIIDKAEKIKVDFVKDILKDIQKAPDEDSKLALTILIMPYLLPRKRGKSEIQETFISYNKYFVKEEKEELEFEEGPYHSAKRFKLDGLPKVSLMSDMSNGSCFAYLDLYGRKHRFANPLRAIEICFQCFVTMNIKYPKTCEQIWLFIQKLIFDVTIPGEPVIPAINTFINDLKK